MPLLDGLSAAKIILKEELAGEVILLSAYNDKTFIEKAKEAGVIGYLVKPIDNKSLITTIEVSLSRCKEFKEVKKNVKVLEKKLESRKIIEKAKGKIMQKLNISEEDAYTHIRNISMKKRVSMEAVAQIIIMSEGEIEKSEEYMEKIRDICLKNTSLSESDIKIIQNISKTLQFVADSSKADVFIDCMTKNQKCAAVVVASAKTRDAKSFYKEDVVGKLAIRKNEPAVLRTLQTGIPSRDIKAITQENIIVKQNVEPIKNEKDEVIAVIISEQDITEDLRESKKLKILAETNEELMCQLEGKKIKYEDRNITYHIDDAILIFDESGILRFKNPVAEELYEKLGYDQELVGMSFSNLALSNVSIEELIKGESIEVEEINIGEMYFQIKYIVQSNKVLKLAMLIRDITDMKEKEKELILKSVAIKEIHHRVKNNLQTIASLLRLQSRRIKGEEFRVAINESINRILSIAITHEMLAKEGIDDVNIKEVINKIKSYIVSFEKNEKLDLTIEIIGDDLAISSDKSTAIALVVNEAIQNCLKHAFKGREKGKITIKVEKGNAYSEISVIDDGIGFDVNSASQSSLGLMIINSLVSDKLKGNLEIQSTSNGTTVNFDFEN